MRAPVLAPSVARACLPQVGGSITRVLGDATRTVDWQAEAARIGASEPFEYGLPPDTVDKAAALSIDGAGTVFSASQGALVGVEPASGNVTQLCAGQGGLTSFSSHVVIPEDGAVLVQTAGLAKFALS